MADSSEHYPVKLTQAQRKVIADEPDDEFLPDSAVVLFLRPGLARDLT
jgi:hypothetical protein